MDFHQVLPLGYRAQGHPVQTIVSFKIGISHSNLVQEIEHSLKRSYRIAGQLAHVRFIRFRLWLNIKNRQPHFEVDGAKVGQGKTKKSDTW